MCSTMDVGVVVFVEFGHAINDAKRLLGCRSVVHPYQVVTVDFKAEKADKLNAQIEDFLKALGDPEKKESNFLFQGARVVMIRLSDVSAAEVVSMIQKPQETAKA